MAYCKAIVVYFRCYKSALCPPQKLSVVLVQKRLTNLLVTWQVPLCSFGACETRVITGLCQMPQLTAVAHFSASGLFLRLSRKLCQLCQGRNCCFEQFKPEVKNLKNSHCTSVLRVDTHTEDIRRRLFWFTIFFVRAQASKGCWQKFYTFSTLCGNN